MTWYTTDLVKFNAYRTGPLNVNTGEGLDGHRGAGLMFFVNTAGKVVWIGGTVIHGYDGYLGFFKSSCDATTSRVRALMQQGGELWLYDCVKATTLARSLRGVLGL